jgi:hypothetical protein
LRVDGLDAGLRLVRRRFGEATAIR